MWIYLYEPRWVREFLDDQNQGLDSLIDYLSFRLVMMRHEQRQTESRANSEERINSREYMFSRHFSTGQKYQNRNL